MIYKLLSFFLQIYALGLLGFSIMTVFNRTSMLSGSDLLTLFKFPVLLTSDEGRDRLSKVIFKDKESE